MPRYIRIPDPITINGQDRDGKPAKQELKFSTFFLDAVYADRRFTSDVAELDQAMALKARIVDANVGDIVDIDQDVWARLKSVVENPQGGFFGPLGEQTRPFVRLIQDAGEDRKALEAAAPA